MQSERYDNMYLQEIDDDSVVDQNKKVTSMGFEPTPVKTTALT